ncbi:alpha/beta fold hydrolase [Sandaracinus amylolyticus]|uniref:alpha/beta fold hydrolase n=1 Tax=Sandaracinus amylolyticus TaxID=927083 RepID=UPI001F261946|nr:alpha/beta hydrolase [Sandaracinus amylolyticus]UJR82939.1 Hypothetical protein I5071_50040 [Sandaracinus amylolyticus]
MNKQDLARIVLVHGAWADGSGWEGVHAMLTRAGHRVSIVQHATASLADDVAMTKLVLDEQDGPVVLVGHSSGGAVITEAGRDPKVAALVYVAGWVPDSGESVEMLLANPSVPASQPPILPPRGGFLWLDRARFHESFAADVDAAKAAFLADSQPPWGVAAYQAKVTSPAWRTKPSWYLVSANDRMIPPDGQRWMAKRAGSSVVESDGSHAIYVSRPDVVASLIMRAGAAVRATREQPSSPRP